MWTAIKNNNNNVTDYSGKYYDPSHPKGINDNGATLGEYVLDGYWYDVDDVSSNTSIVAKAMIFGSSETNYGYWLASRGVIAYSDYASFVPGRVFGGVAGSYGGSFSSNGVAEGDGGYYLRPLVSLTSEIPAAGEILDFSGQFTGG